MALGPACFMPSGGASSCLSKGGYNVFYSSDMLLLKGERCTGT